MTMTTKKTTTKAATKKPAEKKPDEKKEQSRKEQSKRNPSKVEDAAGDGYEKVEEMTPEQLAKIAGTAPA